MVHWVFSIGLSGLCVDGWDDALFEAICDDFFCSMCMGMKLANIMAFFLLSTIFDHWFFSFCIFAERIKRILNVLTMSYTEKIRLNYSRNLLKWKKTYLIFSLPKRATEIHIIIERVAKEHYGFSIFGWNFTYFCSAALHFLVKTLSFSIKFQWTRWQYYGNS